MAASEHQPGVFVRQCVDGFRRMAQLMAAAADAETIYLLDWPQLIRHATELTIAAAIEDGGLGAADLHLEELCNVK